MHIPTEYRTNPLSAVPGGHVIKAVEYSSAVRIYDNVKNARSYLSSMNTDKYKTMYLNDILIFVDGEWLYAEISKGIANIKQQDKQ